MSMPQLETPETAHNNAQSDAIVVTESAAAKIYKLKAGENNFELKLRIYVTGGGCSGFQYGFSFAEEVEEDDFIFNQKVLGANLASSAIHPEQAANPSIEILVDAMSMQYLKGAKIDYRKDIHGEQFIIENNPNAKTTCGCGSSFSAND
jgi:iron-sulfur cluster insertion protein